LRTPHTAPVLVGLLTALTAIGATARVDSGAPPGDLAFASYAFASELGSGIYELNGRALQIYRIPFADEHEGWRITLPVTIGLLDFHSGDVIALDLPRGIGSVSFVPGIENDFQASPGWTLTQFVHAGYTRTSGTAPDAVVAGIGLRSTLRSGPGLYQAEVRYAVADLRGPLAGDAFLRLRNALQADLPTPATAGTRRLQLAPFLIVDDYAVPPTSPLTGRKAQHLQAEAGFTLNLAPRPSRLGVPLPSIGLSYRSAGDLSGWRLAIGAPF
jgi:hypothetical protein